MKFEYANVCWIASNQLLWNICLQWAIKYFVTKQLFKKIDSQTLSEMVLVKTWKMVYLDNSNNAPQPFPQVCFFACCDLKRVKIYPNPEWKRLKSFMIRQLSCHGKKALLTKFGYSQRLESCDLQLLCWNLPNNFEMVF